MEPEDPVGSRDRTARTVGQIVKYSREVNQSETVDQVASLTIEALVHVLEGHPEPTVVELAGGEQRVLGSMTAGDPGGPVVGRAIDADRPVVRTATDVPMADLDAVHLSGNRPSFEAGEAATVAAPSVRPTDDGDAGVVLVVRWAALDVVEPYHVKPLEYLADHVATAVLKIRSRERLERARNDLATRKRMVELYDRLLRHDLGNDLQVITGFTEALQPLVEDPQAAEYATRIEDAAQSAVDLIGRVGDIVKTLEREREPVARSLRPIVESAVAETDQKYESLAISADPESFECEVYAGDLLETVFSNILSNAAVHNDGPVTVEVDADRPNRDTVVLVFADDGVGVPPERREKVFEMGTKGPDSDGTGLGLGFVQALTESYGGTVTLEASPAGGAELRVTLDRA